MIVAKLIVLGSSSAIPDEEHENTHLVVTSQNRVVLIDCGNNPILRLSKVGISLDSLTDIILTHFHPDHVSSFPILLMHMWLLGRKEPLIIHGLDHTLDRIKRMMTCFDWESWRDLFPVRFHILVENQMACVLESDELKIYSSPVNHLIPTIGLRIENLSSHKVVVYSCDTAPCPSVVDLARRANILIHEAAGEATGHTSASQAGEIATQAGAENLYLIHYNGDNQNVQTLVEQARRKFSEPVELAKDFMEIPF